MDIRKFFGGRSAPPSKSKDENSNIQTTKSSECGKTTKNASSASKPKKSPAAAKASKRTEKDQRKKVVGATKDIDSDVEIIDVSDTEDFRNSKSATTGRPETSAATAKKSSHCTQPPATTKSSSSASSKTLKPTKDDSKKSSSEATVTLKKSKKLIDQRSDDSAVETEMAMKDEPRKLSKKQSAETKIVPSTNVETGLSQKLDSKYSSSSKRKSLMNLESKESLGELKTNSSAKKLPRKESGRESDLKSSAEKVEIKVSAKELDTKSTSKKCETKDSVKDTSISVVSDSSDELDSKTESSIKPKKQSSRSKKRRKELSSSDEDFCGGESRSSAKKKSTLKLPDIDDVFSRDTDSDEEPLPKYLREQKSRRKGRKRNLGSDSDGERPSILESIGRMQAKQVSSVTKSVQPKVESEKRIISPADFFGVTPVQISTGSKVKKESAPEMPTATAIANEDIGVSAVDNNNEVMKAKEKSAKRLKVESEIEVISPSPADKSLSSKLASKLKAETSSVKEQKGNTKTVDLEPVDGTGEVDKVSTLSPVKNATDDTLNIVTPARMVVTEEDMVVGSSEKSSMQKKGSNYRGFLNREPPRALGSKDLPEGQDNCLEGLTFVLTGVLESIGRDDTKSLIERYGGKVTLNVSRNTSYLVAGRDCGESKLTKAEQLGTKKLDEDGLFALIRSLPAKKSKYEIIAEKELAKSTGSTPASASVGSRRSLTPTTPSWSACSAASSMARCMTQDSQSQATQLTQSPDGSLASQVPGGESLLWVDKYRPTNMRQIIGQQGDKSNANKLLTWLNNWHRNLGRKPVFGRSEDGAGHKAALLSGPPGIGKTTTAQIVCETAGFSFVELNASDTRSKRSLQTEVSEALNNHTLVDFFGASRSSDHASLDGRKHCLVMDEVDGMAGNEDRGGVQELIQLIKHTKIPIICMCNDRNHPKMRSLSGYCFDLRFQRPRVEQIKGPLLSIIYKEGLKIPPAALTDIISAANHDIRQVIHNLSMWTARDKSLTYDQLKSEAAKAQKDLRLGPFDVCRKVFVGGEETANMTLADKMDLFFHDYSIGPLFVQENYIHVTPFGARGVQQHLRCLSRAADSIARGDVVDAYIRRGQNWTLLPSQAVYASVVPGEAMRGSIGQMIQFPAWLGKNSTTSKNDRIVQELCHHMRLHISANRRSLALEYLPYLRRLVTSPLVIDGSAGVDSTVSMLHAYDLQREDFDSILEVTSWSTTKDPMSHVDSKVKGAFTRAYNKASHLAPYSTAATATKRGRAAAGVAAADDLDGIYDDQGEGGANPEESEHSDDDVGVDAMIKQKKATTKKSAGKRDDRTTNKPAAKKGQSKGKDQASQSRKKK